MPSGTFHFARTFCMVMVGLFVFSRANVDSKKIREAVGLRKFQQNEEEKFLQLDKLSDCQDDLFGIEVHSSDSLSPCAPDASYSDHHHGVSYRLSQSPLNPRYRTSLVGWFLGHGVPSSHSLFTDRSLEGKGHRERSSGHSFLNSVRQMAWKSDAVLKSEKEGAWQEIGLESRKEQPLGTAINPKSLPFGTEYLTSMRETKRRLGVSRALSAILNRIQEASKIKRRQRTFPGDYGRGGRWVAVRDGTNRRNSSPLRVRIRVEYPSKKNCEANKNDCVFRGVEPRKAPMVDQMLLMVGIGRK